jgi:hypothetical protein
MIIMVVGLASTAANSILNVYRNTAYAAIATVFVQLHTADPGVAGTTAISVGSVTRNQATWNAAAGGSMTISALAAWTNGGTSETISHVSLWTLSSAGTFLQSAALSVAQAWVSTNTLTLTTFTFSYAPIAA